jgi:hypothetical protein
VKNSITIAIFLHGTIIMHSSGKNQSRDERVKQVLRKDEPIYKFSDYIPISKAVEKLLKWSSQGAKIVYLSFHKNKKNIKEDKIVLRKFGFPKGKILYRKRGREYNNLIESIMPDILIEDDCESIGGEKEMIITKLSFEFRSKINSIVVKEFEGIDHLPSYLIDLQNL